MSKVQESKANKTKAEQNKNKLNYTLAAYSTSAFSFKEMIIIYCLDIRSFLLLRIGYVKLCYFAIRFSKRIQYFNRDRINIYFLSVNYICSVNLLIKRVKISARDSLYGLLCKKYSWTSLRIFCVFQTFK